MKINKPKGVTEVEAAFARYEAAFISSDVNTLTAPFWKSPLTIRYGIGEILYGSDAIVAFSRRALAGGSGPRAVPHYHHHLWRRFRHRLDAVSPEQRVRQGGPADAELDAPARGLAHRRGACEPDRRKLSGACI